MSRRRSKKRQFFAIFEDYKGGETSRGIVGKTTFQHAKAKAKMYALSNGYQLVGVHIIQHRYQFRGVDQEIKNNEYI